MYLTTTMNKTVNSKKKTQLKAISITPKNAKSHYNLLSGQNRVEFVTDITQTLKKITQALLARLYIFPSLPAEGLF